MQIKSLCRNTTLGIVLCTIFATGLKIPAAAAAQDSTPDAKITSVFSAPLASVRGEQLTVLMVTYPPGGASPPHHHAGSVFAYVLSGVIKSENSATGPVKNFSEGESFFEPAGSEHLISANGSDTEPARLLVFFIAPASAKLTIYDKAFPDQ